MSVTDNLLNFIFDIQKPVFYADFESWVRGSRRFREFAIEYRTKIRAKLNNARGEGIKDLRSELTAAALLLTEPQFELEYEKYAAIKQRGPDFTVTFKTHTPFNVEVRRIATAEVGDAKTFNGKLIAVISDKAKQMPPSIANLLWVDSAQEITEAQLNNAAEILRANAESKNDEFFAKRSHATAAAFLKNYRHLSAVLLRNASGNLIWLNSLAKHALLPRIVSALRQMKLK